ncbi:hypothetical protein J5N97_005532 [Dioscorea zingiberensis]|uniref:Uncharacterized protein n=1 Tax=Dioscorea zingiberensis TaxID=325984 RepID=A0A9D5D8N9_9LILI|nr:hypothetical protein J5N97_005532 [Dioscorea zingiberensis]
MAEHAKSFPFLSVAEDSLESASIFSLCTIDTIPTTKSSACAQSRAIHGGSSSSQFLLVFQQTWFKGNTCVEKTLQSGGFNSTAEASETGSGGNLNFPMQQIWQQRPPCLRPICCNLNGDRHVMETVANVLTSLPFIFLGLQAPRKNMSSALYANSLIGVGVVSSLYHSSRGKVRKYFRWADYTTIAATTVCLSKALWNENPKVLMAASALLLPFQPLMVSAVHTGMMEVAFVRRASTNPDLKMAHSMHTMSSVLGGLLFVADDFFPQTPYLHAAWHLAAAVGVSTCNKLLE